MGLPCTAHLAFFFQHVITLADSSHSLINQRCPSATLMCRRKHCTAWQSIWQSQRSLHTGRVFRAPCWRVVATGAACLWYRWPDCERLIAVMSLCCVQALDHTRGCWVPQRRLQELSTLPDHIRGVSARAGCIVLAHAQSSHACADVESCRLSGCCIARDGVWHHACGVHLPCGFAG